MVRFRYQSSVSIETEDVRIAARVSISVGSRYRELRRRRTSADLRSELSCYSTPAELRDLEAILDRYADDDTEEIRAVLAGQAMTRLTTSRLRGPVG
jgi:hypothetical protein